MTMENADSRSGPSDSDPPVREDAPATAARSPLIPMVVLLSTLAVLAVGGLLVWRAQSKVNNVALVSAPRPVTVIRASAATFRDSRKYVGTLRPWIEANVGPQFISAYVDTVLVRPGAVVKRNEVLATLDCRYSSASSQAVAAEARAIDAMQRAVAHESTRIQSLLDGGFVSPNEAEQKAALSASEEAKLASQRAKLVSTTLEVSDCILRAPFDGEVATRTIDPGAFVRPGPAIVSVVDRSTARMTVDVPESDFKFVPPGAAVSLHVIATDETRSASISRRSPAADPDTRTVHVEVDVADPKRLIPVNTTGELRIEVGDPAPATTVPLYAASVSGSKATLFVVEDGIAHKRTLHVLGEQGSSLFVEPLLKAGTSVVTEGQFLLEDGERVAAKLVPYGTVQMNAATVLPSKDGAP
jgi:membrane fusion protein (multidrug efflux system)